MTDFRQDLRYGLRGLARAPLFTAAAALSLALGIGANTAVFSLIDALFLQPLPIAQPGRVVAVFGTDDKAAGAGGQPAYDPISFPNYADLARQADFFSRTCAYLWVPLSLTGGGQAEQVVGQLVTGSYFDTLGARAALGRTFLPDEDAKLGAAPVAVLGHGLWQRRFGADRGIVGRKVLLDNQPFTVVGVMPRGFRGLTTLFTADLWVPMAMRPQLFAFNQFFEQRRWRMLNVAARLAPGVEAGRAAAAVRTIGERLQREYPAENPGRGLQLLPIAQATIDPRQREGFVRTGAVLAAISALVLLIACANVANLLLARAAARRREIAVRLALGVSRARLFGQLLVESLLLAALAGALAVPAALLGRGALWRLRPPAIPDDAIAFSLDGRTLACALVLALLSGLLFGLVPALRASRSEVVSDLKDAAGERVGGRTFGLRNVLVVVQVAISCVALIGASLCLRSVQNEREVDLGFKPGRLVAAGLNLAAQQYDPARGRVFQRRLLERLAALPEVASATLAQARPLAPNGVMRSLLAQGQDNPEGGTLAGANSVELRYFATVGLPLAAGRDFQDSDAQEGKPVAIVNQTLARRLWPGGQPLGRRFNFVGETTAIEIVGVARDCKVGSLSEEARPYVYLPLRQVYSPLVEIVARGRVKGEAALGSVRRAVRDLDPNLPLMDAATIDEMIGRAQWQPRLIAVLLSCFGGLALVLAVMGIYSVLAYTVRQRRREAGIRIALGARRLDLARMVYLQAAAVVAAGLALGLAAAAAASRVAASLLFGISATDPVTFAGVSLLLAAMALAAGVGPAISSGRTSPLLALRGG